MAARSSGGGVSLSRNPLAPARSALSPHPWAGAPSVTAATGLTGGAVSVAAYGLVLWARTRGAPAPIAALRETSIIMGAIIGAVFFGERLGAVRAVAGAVVVTGIILIDLS
jgi:drug/metabolite transporter (DMT)-like permease